MVCSFLFVFFREPQYLLIKEKGLGIRVWGVGLGDP